VTRLLALALGLATGCTCAARHVDDAGATGLDAAVDGGFDAGLDAPATDAGHDAWIPIPDAAVATTCIQAVESEVGARCSLDGRNSFCLGGDLCCTVEARCYDGRLFSLRRPERCDEAARPADCAPAPAAVRGATPLGDVAFTSVYASFTFAFAVDVAIVFTGDDPFAVCGGDRLGLWLFPRDDPDTGTLGYVGTHDAVATLVVDGALETARALVDIERYDPPGDDAPTARLVGRFSVPTWAIEADIDVEGCADLDRSGP